MTDAVKSKTKKKLEAATPPADEKRARLPHSVRKYVRRTKAALRREHTAADAEKAIQQLVQRLRR